jgi:type VI secretion system secreted protein Hcp
MSALRRSVVRRALGVAVLAGCVAAVPIVASSSATARTGHAGAVDGLFLQWGGPKAGHAGLARRAIQVDSFQWGVGRGIGTIGGNSTRRASSPSVSEFTISRKLDGDVAPRLFQDLTGGTEYDHLSVKLVKNQRVVLTYRFDDVEVTGYSVSSGGDVPTESVSFNFTKLEIKYGSQNLKTGTVSQAGWDLAYTACKTGC